MKEEFMAAIEKRLDGLRDGFKAGERVASRRTRNLWRVWTAVVLGRAETRILTGEVIAL